MNLLQRVRAHDLTHTNVPSITEYIAVVDSTSKYNFLSVWQCNRILKITLDFAHAKYTLRDGITTQLRYTWSRSVGRPPTLSHLVEYTVIHTSLT